MRVLSFLALTAVLSSGCTRNAIFELELELPANPPGPQLYAVVEARSDLGFEEVWPEGGGLEGIALSASCERGDDPPPCADRQLDPSCSAVVSIVGDSDDLERPLRVRVRFCADPACTGPTDAGAPEHDVEIERAFYLGRYTQARVCIDEAPSVTSPTAEVIERCDVRCREGTAAMYCRLDGTHFCE